jgi:hypothetical protein
MSSVCLVAHNAFHVVDILNKLELKQKKSVYIEFLPLTYPQQ